MSARAASKTAKAYVLGRKGFAAISAVEGLKLGRASEARLERTRALEPEQRRAETIRAFTQKRTSG